MLSHQTPSVLAIVSNYRRPANIRPICERLATDGGCDIVIADNAPGVGLGFLDLEHVPEVHKSLPIADIWRWRENSGPPARWWPALAWSHKYHYTLLVDDDHMLSVGLVQALVAQADALQDRFAVIGRIGRGFRCRRGRWQYRKRNCRHGVVDMAGAGYFFVSERLLSAVRLRNELAANGAVPSMLWHDDLILNCGIQRDYGFPSWMPTQPWATRKLNRFEYAFSATAAYRDVRDDLINLCARLGWRSLRVECAISGQG